MILSDGEIKEAIRQRKIIIRPPPTEEQFTTSALDLMLGDEMLELKTAQELQGEEPAGVERPLIIDPTRIDITKLLQRYAKPLPREPDGSFVLPPGKFVLGMTREFVELPRRSKIAARVEGRSTLARLGLVVHLTAPTIHAGFPGHTQRCGIWVDHPPQRFVRGEGAGACNERRKRPALPAGPTERGGPPPLSRSPPDCASGPRDAP